MAAAGDLGHRLCVEHFGAFAKAFEMGGVAEIMGMCSGAGGAVDLARAIEIGGRDGEVVYRAGGECLCCAVECDDGAVIAAACVILAGEFVRQVDHEAGIAACCAGGKGARIKERDTGFRRQLAQAAGGRQASEACADHGKVCGVRAFERGRGRSWRENGAPRSGAAVDGQAAGAERGCHASGSPRRGRKASRPRVSSVRAGAM